MVRRRPLSLFGHVARMLDYVPDKTVRRVACDVRDGVPPFPNWRRLWGRPPIAWLHQICSDCGLSAADALNCAEDRPRGERTLRPPRPCVDDHDDAMLALHIFCRRVSVRPSVTRPYCTKTAKRRITETAPCDSPGTLVF